MRIPPPRRSPRRLRHTRQRRCRQRSRIRRSRKHARRRHRWHRSRRFRRHSRASLRCTCQLHTQLRQPQLEAQITDGKLRDIVRRSKKLGIRFGNNCCIYAVCFFAGCCSFHKAAFGFYCRQSPGNCTCIDSSSQPLKDVTFMQRMRSSRTPMTCFSIKLPKQAAFIVGQEIPPPGPPPTKYRLYDCSTCMRENRIPSIKKSTPNQFGPNLTLAYPCCDVFHQLHSSPTSKHQFRRVSCSMLLMFSTILVVDQIHKGS